MMKTITAFTFALLLCFSSMGQEDPLAASDGGNAVVATVGAPAEPDGGVSVAAKPSPNPVASVSASVGPTIPTDVNTVDDAKQAVEVLVWAAENGSWPLFSGMLVVLLIWFLDRIVGIKSRVPGKAIPWVAAALGIGTSVGAVLLTGGLSTGSAVLQGFLGGATSVGLWELGLKHLLPKKEETSTV